MTNSFPTPAPLTSLSSLATSFRSPRTNSRSSTMILICSFTLVLEAAGGPSAGEDEEGVPLDLADILWGQARQVSTGGRAEAAARPRPWRCCGRCRPTPPTFWTLPGQRRVAALGARQGGRTAVLPSTPRDAALGAGLQTGEQRACASSRRRPPLSRTHALAPRPPRRPPGRRARGCQLQSPRPGARRALAGHLGVREPGAGSAPCPRLASILKCPPLRSPLCVFAQLARPLPCRPLAEPGSPSTLSDNMRTTTEGPGFGVKRP